MSFVTPHHLQFWYGFSKCYLLPMVALSGISLVTFKILDIKDYDNFIGISGKDYKEGGYNFVIG